MNYEQYLLLIENNAEEITHNVMKEIRDNEVIIHYLSIAEEVREERIFNVIRNIYERLGSWMNRNKSKNTLFAYYANVGAHRCMEGIPLDEVVMVFQLIKREVWYKLREKIVVDNSFTFKHLRYMEISYQVFFDRIIHSLIVGYQSELGKIIEGGKDREILQRIFRRDEPGGDRQEKSSGEKSASASCGGKNRQKD